MGLIKAAAGAIGGTLGDQWKEYFYCDAMDADVLVVKAKHMTSNKKGGNGNIITDGSTVVVADGQCMLVVDQGEVVEMCAEPGVYEYAKGTSPSIFMGDLLDGEEGKLKQIITTVANDAWKRFQYGGQAARDQRVYYINTKEIPGNKYGTPTPIPFRVVDNNIGLDVDISIRCNGEYSYRIVNPMAFYINVCGNVDGEYCREEIDSMLKTELMTALQPAFAKISEQGIRYSALPAHTLEISDALNEILTKKWMDLRGLRVVSFGVNSVSASKEDEDMIKQLQKSAVMRNPNMAAATLVGAQADAMRTAAANEGGAMTGFMGMNMANMAGGMNAQNLFAMGQQQVQSTPQAEGWKCSCGTVNTGKFCGNCGSPQPVSDGWTCQCGTVNTGNFCNNCGSPKPAGSWVCQCGTKNEGRFCGNCGSPRK